MKGPICAVTGANGFAGQAIVRRFLAADWHVVALVRRPEEVGIDARRFVLGAPVAPGMLEGVDVLIHAAYDFSLTRWADICRVNVVGSDYLFDAAARAGVKRSIFISSIAAFEGCRSLYGRGKLATEEAARARGGVAIRPGMLYSETNGGIAGKIAAVARRLPVIPMIGRGDDPLYTCHVDDLAKLAAALAQAEKIDDAVVPAANATPVTLLDMVKAASGGKPRVIITTPWQWLAAGLWLAERLGLRPGFRSDSVVSLTHGNPAPDFSATEKFPVRFRAFR